MRSTRKLQDQPANQEHHRTGQHGQKQGPINPQDRISKKQRWSRRCFSFHTRSMPRYRPNVAFILRNSSGEILVCERSDWPGCWQFPQGGVKKNETLLEALHREVEEELGLRPAEYRLLSRKGPYRYLFTGGRKKAGYDGQEQQYFLGEAVNPHVVLRFDATHEFRAARWLPPADYNLACLPPMKRAVYAAVFRDFFGLGTPDAPAR